MPEQHDAAPRVAIGFDPGAAHVGWCALAVDPAGVHYSGSGVFDVEPSDPGLAALRLGAADLFVRFTPNLVGVERVVAVYPRGRLGASMASGLVGAAWTGGEIAGLAAARGLGIRTLTHTAIKVAIGAPAGDGRAVAAALRSCVAGWPIRMNEPSRDAGACALAVLCGGRGDDPDGGR
jgi:Holliday junction resolvasome RuvABC endonuclease subunit